MNFGTNKEYKTFDSFYADGYSFAEEIKQLTQGQSAGERVNFARTHISKDVLNGYINIGKLSVDVIKELESTSSILKFSIDNIVKNCITHSDVKLEDYLKIPQIAERPSKIIKSKNGYDVMLFQENEKYDKLIVKTTKNKNENFVKSFHLLKEKRYNQYK